MCNFVETTEPTVGQGVDGQGVKVRGEKWRVACCIMEINSFQSTSDGGTVPCLLVVATTTATATATTTCRAVVQKSVRRACCIICMYIYI